MTVSTTDVHTSIPEFDRADRMRKSLKHAGVSVNEMAEYLGITRETVSRYANHADVKVPLQTMRLWALRTGVPLEWLQSGTTPNGPRGDGRRTSADEAQDARSLD
ncbi:helix-turn-helix domain-containing protein [Rhodococcus pyridinivorans]|uniref:helix-turn-helix domain-containing protein n=1 Tax=Rhodococcus pyridinivorans TaxID=103816 RepID=UPI001D148A9A|nr:helix-turn-helix transcriptional regulator [Rhodococcus pyridinivorans]